MSSLERCEALAGVGPGVRVSGAEVLRGTAMVASAVGVAAIGALGATGGTPARKAIAGVAVAALVVAVVCGSLWMSVASPAKRLPVQGAQAGGPSGRLVAGLVGAVTFLAVQTWFTWGESIAGGDMAPPEGTAWVSRLFVPWSWNGSNLGAPNANASQLPWAVTLEMVHLLGGPAWLAQRLWITALFVGAGLACFALLRVVGLGSVGAGVGALVYVFNPYVTSSVGDNDVFLAAMVLLAACPAIVLAGARGRISRRKGILLLAACAPMMGFVYGNPPLAAMVALVSATAAVAAGWLWGRASGFDAAKVLVGGGAVMAVLSAYWIVPSLLQISAVATGRLSSLGGWAWTEGRATLANGLWLDTTWGWKFPSYYPYAPAYSHLPLSAIKYLLPLLAFGAIPVVLRHPAQQRQGALGRLAMVGAGGSLFLIVLGTGTNAPGSMLFDPLYHLPYGWLLREPGRFLMAASLGYAVLVGVVAERVAAAIAASGAKAPRQRVGVAHYAGVACAVVLLGTLAPAFPQVTGATVPSRARGIYPPARVRFPSYWKETAQYLNHRAPPGNLLVLPQDDFYQMPYKWGYYGNDGFITNLISRHVLDPSGQGYQALSPVVARTVSQFSAAVVAGHWSLATRLLSALGTRELLVRGDVISNFPGRKIVSPRLLAQRLSADPAMRLVYRRGPLWLFEDRSVSASPATLTSKVATVNTSKPDLSVLGKLPTGTALVSGPMRAGLPGVLQLPGVAHWRLEKGTLSTDVVTRPGWRYRLVRLGWSAKHGVSSQSRDAAGSLRLSARGAAKRVSVSLGANQVVDGSLRSGPWQNQVGNCDAVGGIRAGSALSARVLPGAGPGGSAALRLGASVDSACESTPLRPMAHQPVGQPFLLSLWVKHLRGAAPRICVWETAARRCAPGVPTLAASRRWVHVQSVVTPSSGSGRLAIFVYADSNSPGQSTVNEYSRVAAYPLRPPGRLALIARPLHQITQRLEVADSSYSASWQLGGSRHVLVDGVANGWLVNNAQTKVKTATFALAGLDRAALAVSVAEALAVLVVLAAGSWRRARGEHG